MNRRTFLETSAAAGLAYSSITTTAAEIAKGPVKRVALIGSGWYGKIDLFRLIQVAPVEVVALCDVDSTMLSEAADMVAKRQKSANAPRPTPTIGRCSRRTTLIWFDRHTGSLARTADD